MKIEIEENNARHTNTTKPNFKNTGFTQTEHLILKDGRIIISHNKEAEIAIQIIGDQPTEGKAEAGSTDPQKPKMASQNNREKHFL